MAQALTIGRLARSAGFNIQTIRFYQRRGLIGQPAKPPGGVRRYAPDVVGRLRFIKRAQVLGFSLDEIGILLGLSDGEHCAETKALAEKKLKLVEGKIDDLAAMRKALRSLVTKCARGGAGQGCPIIDALARDPAEPAAPRSGSRRRTSRAAPTAS